MENMFARASANLIDRIGGPMTFRLFLQPTVAAYFAIRAGLKDARERRRLTAGSSSPIRPSAGNFYARAWKTSPRFFSPRSLST